MKKEYIEAELEIIKLAANDIVTASSGNVDENGDSWSGYY